MTENSEKEKHSTPITGVSLIEEVGGYRILNRRGTPKISLACPFHYLNKKGGYCVHSILVPVPGSRLLITTLPLIKLLSGISPCGIRSKIIVLRLVFASMK